MSLPVELLDTIFQSVASKDLLHLSNTCTAWGPVAQRLLYRNIAVSPWSHNIAVISTLVKRPDLAHYVRSFSITSTSTPPFAAFYRLLAQALSNMTEITSLSLLVDSCSSWLLKWVAQKSTFHRLQQFSCSYALDWNVAAFLDHTPALLELEVDSVPYDATSPVPLLSDTTIPHLAQFIGSARAARAIVPGRPVESIHLNEGDLVEEDVVCMAQGTAQVVVLGATASSAPVPLLESIAQHLPHLAYLRIMTTYPFTQAPEIRFMDQVANALSSLPDLTAFELSGMQWGSSKRADDGGKRVWQSAPLSTTFNASQEAPVDPELFLQY